MDTVDQLKAPQAVSVTVALLMLPAIFIVTAAFLALNLVFGSAEYYVGFVFVLYWSSMERADFAKFPAAAVGSMVGLGLALLLRLLEGWFDATTAIVIFLVLLLPPIFFQIRGMFATLVNNATMLMLTVGTISYVQMHADFGHLFISLIIGIVFFGAVAWLIKRIAAAAERPGKATLA